MMIVMMMMIMMMTMLCQGEGSSVLDWDDAELLQQERHKHVWDLVHRVVFCPIAKVEYSTVQCSAVQCSTVQYSAVQCSTEL